MTTTQQWQSSRVAGIAPSATVSMTDRIKQLRAAGERIISLSTGTPDFDTPAHIKAAAKAALDEDYTYVSYTQSAGLPALREAIAAKLTQEHGIPTSADDVLVTIGVKEGVFVAAQACFNPGDEVLLPSPIWVTYEACLRLAGAVPVPVPLRAADGFRLDLDALAARVTPRTRAILLNSPANPTGIVLSRAELEAIAALAERHGLLVLSDEIYESMVYGNARHMSVAALPGMAERTLTFNGFSKGYAMTGWRVGYVTGPRPILRDMLKIHQHSVTCACSFAQLGALAALSGPQEDRLVIAATLAARREQLVAGLNSIPGVRCAAPEGGLFCFPDIRGLGMTDEECARFFLERAQVSALPGSAFGPGGEGHLRMTFAKRRAEDLTQAITQLQAAVAAR